MSTEASDVDCAANHPDAGHAPVAVASDIAVGMQVAASAQAFGVAVPQHHHQQTAPGKTLPASETPDVKPHDMRALPLPAGTVVPSGALQKTAPADGEQPPALVLRSTSTVPLRDAMEGWERPARQLQAAIAKGDAQNALIRYYCNNELLTRYSDINYFANHPAVTIALFVASKHILTHHGALMHDVACAYAAALQIALVGIAALLLVKEWRLFFGPDSVARAVCELKISDG